MYYSTYYIGQTVYFTDDESTVKRAKVKAIRISKNMDDKTEYEYTVRLWDGSIDAVDEADLFRSAESAFWSLEPKVETVVYPEIPEPAEPIIAYTEGSGIFPMVEKDFKTIVSEGCIVGQHMA